MPTGLLAGLLVLLLVGTACAPAVVGPPPTPNVPPSPLTTSNARDVLDLMGLRSAECRAPSPPLGTYCTFEGRHDPTNFGYRCNVDDRIASVPAWTCRFEIPEHEAHVWVWGNPARQPLIVQADVTIRPNGDSTHLRALLHQVAALPLEGADPSAATAWLTQTLATYREGTDTTLTGSLRLTLIRLLSRHRLDLRPASAPPPV